MNNVGFTSTRPGLISESQKGQSCIYEPSHDKTKKMTVRPAKTQISLGLRPV